MQRIRTSLRVLGLTAAGLPLLISPTLAQSGVANSTVSQLTYHLDSGTSILSFDNTTKAGQYLRFEVDPQTSAGSATITASNLAYSGGWLITTADFTAATYSTNVSITPNYSDLASSTVTIPNSQAVSFFQLPVDTFGGQFSFDISETGASSGAPTDFIVYANDDLVEIADLQFTPGSSQAVLVSAASGISIVGTNGTLDPTPEPSPWMAIGIGVLGLGGLVLRSRRQNVS